MSNHIIYSSLAAIGFLEGAKDKNGFYKDIGTPVSGLFYLVRDHRWGHIMQTQKVSLCSYEGRFLEAVLQVYETPYQKSPILCFASIFRDEQSLMAALDMYHKPPDYQSPKITKK